ncbi:MAG: hypothetical protein V4857_29010 [Pseudomonadota bacterium]
MQLDKLQIELRPRTNAQALDLGPALLRSCLGAAYKAWLALWLPVIALSAVLTALVPEAVALWLLLAWWCKPLLERAPLYVLSRQVFGQSVTWGEAVRAWPRQLGGGWFGLLTWGRPFAASRCLMQPVWQLEQARGKAARVRRKVLGRNGTMQSAALYGVVCFGFEVVLAFGALALLGSFFGEGANPLALFGGKSQYLPGLVLAAFALATAIMGPVYTAGGLTLYLNRRATLEAWDIEIRLRQIKPPAAPRARAGAALSLLLAPMLLAPLLFAGVLLEATPAMAAPAQALVAPAADAACAPPQLEFPYDGRLMPHGTAQDKLRKQLAQVYATPALRGYECTLEWQFKDKAEKEPRELPRPNLDWVAQVAKVLFIGAAIGLCAWLLYRYRGMFPEFGRRPPLRVATEVGGLDIRPDSLPDDVAGHARALWAGAERRAALALLYRATLSRLVAQNGLLIPQGATEGDCLRLAQQAQALQKMARERLDVVVGVTGLWLGGAYGNRWPADPAFESQCAAWQTQFGAAGGRRA